MLQLSLLNRGSVCLHLFEHNSSTTRLSSLRTLRLPTVSFGERLSSSFGIWFYLTRAAALKSKKGCLVVVLLIHTLFMKVKGHSASRRVSMESICKTLPFKLHSGDPRLQDGVMNIKFRGRKPRWTHRRRVCSRILSVLGLLDGLGRYCNHIPWWYLVWVGFCLTGVGSFDTQGRIWSGVFCRKLSYSLSNYVFNNTIAWRLNDIDQNLK